MSAAWKRSARATPRTAGSCGRRTASRCSCRRCEARRRDLPRGCAAARRKARARTMRWRRWRRRNAAWWWETDMAVELGINPITWSNDDMPELGGDIPLETCLAETREAGYAGTELGGKFPRASGELSPILARHHLKLVSGWFDGRILERDVAAEFAAIEPHLTLL